MSERIAIDSLEELVSYVEMHFVTDEVREMILNMEEYSSPDFHFGFARFIRNRFILDDSEVVPNLIDEYMLYVNPDIEYRETLSEEAKEMDDYFTKAMYLNPDSISGAVCKILWHRLHNKI